VLCEHCLAEIAGTVELLPNPPFNSVQQTVCGLPVPRGVWRVIEVLYRRRGRAPVSLNSLMLVLYGDRLDPPEARIIPTLICRARPIVALAGWHIRNYHGRGWELVAAGSAEARADIERRRNQHHRGNPLAQREWPPEFMDSLFQATRPSRRPR
jgi:hypothetical protein